MKNKNEFQSYVNYFQKWDGAGATGIGLLAVGFLLIWAGFRIPFSWFFAIASIIIGGILFFYGNTGRASDADIQNIIEKSKEKIHFKELEEIPALRKRVPKNPQEQLYEGYLLKKGVLVKKLKNGSLCSSEYEIVKMITLTDGFYLKSLRFSFVSAEQQTVACDIPFAALQDIRIERKSFKLMKGQMPLDAKTCHLVFLCDGTKKVKLPVHDDIYLDELVEKLKKTAGI